MNRSFGKARGDALDLSHALSFCDAPCEVRAGELIDTAASDLLVLTLSAPFRPPMRDRADLAAENRPLFEDLVPRLAALSPGAAIVVVTNPVDAMTWWTLEYSGFPPERVMGIGTLIDSARFRTELSRRFAIHPGDLRAYVLGEHGPAQFAAMSAASAGGEPIGDPALADSLIAKQTESVSEIMVSKGYTNFAIASAVTLVVESFVLNRHRTIPVSVLLDGYYGESGACLSVPCVIGRRGVERILRPRLDERELGLFRRSAEAVREVIAREDARAPRPENREGGSA